MKGRDQVFVFVLRAIHLASPARRSFSVRRKFSETSTEQSIDVSRFK